jgi:sugar lactone lactonase YvrE
MNDKTKSAPFFCHEPVTALATGLARPTGLTVDSFAGKVFFTEDDQSSGVTDWPLSVVNMDGTGKTALIPKLVDPQGLDCDTQARKVYYTEHHAKRVGSVNYDGTNQTVLHTFTGDASFPSDIVVDSTNGFIFVQVEGPLSTGGQLVRMRLDGSNATAIVKDITRAYGIAVDPKSKKAFYVSGGHGGFISSVNYDGSNATFVLQGLEWPFEIAVDVPRQRLVFTTTGVGDGRVTTSRFNGSDVEVVEELGFAPMGVNFGHVTI